MSQNKTQGVLVSKWWLPILWQIFLAFYFIKFFTTPLPFTGMRLCLMALVVYLWAYFWGYFQTEHKKLFAAIIMVICGIIAAPYNFGASVFFQFAAFYIGYSIRPAYALLLLACLVSIILFLSFQYALPLGNFLMPALTVSVSLGFYGIFERQKSISAELLSKSDAQIQRMAAIAERERIGRDLHDVLGHTLTVITLKSSLAKKLLENKNYQDAISEITQVEETARQTSKLIQKVVSDYGDISLQDELNNLCLLLEQSDIKIKTDLQYPSSIDANVKKALSLIIRESVTNVIRHADASHCELQLKQEADQLMFKIKDNGKSSSTNQFGHGLTGIQQRVKILNGIFLFEYDNGTLLKVNIPVTEI